jgi:hypothetical protein
VGLKSSVESCPFAVGPAPGAWQAAARREAPAIAQPRRREVCFFSAWDFHLPPEGGFKLIEFNDSGSGFLFAAIINAVFYEAARLEREKGIAPPPTISAFSQIIENLAPCLPDGSEIRRPHRNRSEKPAGHGVSLRPSPNEGR